jgi:outer membrane lipoprotein SlyB
VAENGFAPNAQATGAGVTAVALAGCDNNWQAWSVGSRTQWNVTKDFYMGVDVAYTKVQSASSATGFVPGVTSAAPGGGVIPTNTACTGTTRCLTASDEGAWSVRFRVHRDFYP